MKKYLLQSKNNAELYFRRTNEELEISTMDLTEYKEEDEGFVFSEEELKTLEKKYSSVFNILIKVVELKDEKLEEFFETYIKYLSITDSKIDALSYAKQEVYGDQKVDDDLLLNHVFTQDRHKECLYYKTGECKYCDQDEEYVFKEDEPSVISEFFDKVDQDATKLLKNVKIYIHKKTK